LLKQDFRSEPVSVPDFQEFLDEAYKNRPDYLAFGLKRKMSEENISLMRSEGLPNLSLVGSYGKNRTNYPGASRTYDISSWNAVLSGSWTLFDGFSTSEKVKEARASWDELASNEENLKLAIAIEVKDALLSLATALEEIKAAQKTLSLAKENYRIADYKFLSGMGTNIEVMEAMKDLNEASINYLQAKYDYEITKARVNKVLGRKIFKKIEGRS
jgi:outer membrane protein TolC